MKTITITTKKFRTSKGLVFLMYLAAIAKLFNSRAMDGAKLQYMRLLS